MTSRVNILEMSMSAITVSLQQCIYQSPCGSLPEPVERTTDVMLSGVPLSPL